MATTESQSDVDGRQFATSDEEDRSEEDGEHDEDRSEEEEERSEDDGIMHDEEEEEEEEISLLGGVGFPIGPVSGLSSQE